MTFVDSIIEKLKRHPKRIVFPDGNDLRVIRAAAILVKHEAVLPVLLGNKEKIVAIAEREGICLEFVMVINPETASDLPLFCQQLERLERYKKLKLTSAKTFAVKPNYFAAMMVQFGQADAVVGGATGYSGSLMRALFQMIKPSSLVKTPLISSCQIMEFPNSEVGENGVLFLGDCGVIPSPTVEQLGSIAFRTGAVARQIFGITPQVALLSFSTKGSAATSETEKIVAATALARQRAHDRGIEMDIDGELQADAALIPEVAAEKAKGSPLAGKANVLIFPDLNSGNITSKLLAHLSGARIYGQILLGLSRPAATLSRASTVDEIVALACIVGLQAVEYRKLYEVESARD